MGTILIGLLCCELTYTGVIFFVKLSMLASSACTGVYLSKKTSKFLLVLGSILATTVQCFYVGHCCSKYYTILLSTGRRLNFI